MIAVFASSYFFRPAITQLSRGVAGAALESSGVNIVETRERALLELVDPTDYDCEILPLDISLSGRCSIDLFVWFSSGSIIFRANSCCRLWTVLLEVATLLPDPAYCCTICTQVTASAFCSLFRSTIGPGTAGGVRCDNPWIPSGLISQTRCGRWRKRKTMLMPIRMMLSTTSFLILTNTSDAQPSSGYFDIFNRCKDCPSTCVIRDAQQ